MSTRITQIERASGAKPTLELARALDLALGADDLLVELWPYVYREAFPDWSRRFMEYAERAVAVREYAAHVVPGLLQTEGYARAVLSVGRTLGSKEQLEERVAVRMGRHWRGCSGPRRNLTSLCRYCRSTRASTMSWVARSTSSPCRTARTEGAHYGQLVEDPDEVTTFAATTAHRRRHPAGTAIPIEGLTDQEANVYDVPRGDTGPGRPPEPPTPRKQPAAAATAAGPPTPETSAPLADADPQAVAVLAALRRVDPRLLLSEREAARLAPAVARWLAVGVGAHQITELLTAGLPDRFLARPAGILAFRLRETPLPAPPPPPAPQTSERPVVLPFQTCDGCDRAFRASEPGHCRGCRSSTSRESSDRLRAAC